MQSERLNRNGKIAVQHSDCWILFSYMSCAAFRHEYVYFALSVLNKNQNSQSPTFAVYILGSL